MCGGKPMLADVFYSVNMDGINGLVEVIGPGLAIVPLRSGSPQRVSTQG